MAYTNSFAGATATTLYALGATNSMTSTSMTKLYQINPPNAGTLVEAGNITNTFLLDIGGTTNTAYGIGLGEGFSANSIITTINETTGATTLARRLVLSPGTPGLSPRGLAVGLGF